MVINIETHVLRIESGDYARKQLLVLRANAVKKGVDEVVAACDKALSYGTGNLELNTREIGIQETIRTLKKLGAESIKVQKEGNKSFVTFVSKSNRKYHLLTRSKSAGTWQTTIDYAEKRREPVFEDSYWVFVDLEKTSPDFYIVPEWWIRNDIFKIHNAYLAANGGKRIKTPESKHHAIDEKRIENWKSRWDLIGL